MPIRKSAAIFAMALVLLNGLWFNPSPAQATIAALATWEVRTTGNDTNGAGFITGASGTDYSQNDNKNATSCTSCGSATLNLSTTDAVTAASTTVTSATANFTSAIVGNIIYLAGGSGSLTGGWYQVTTFTNVTTIHVDRNPGASTGVTMNIGGAMLSPALPMAPSGSTANVTVWVKSGTYSMTTTSTSVAGGAILLGQPISGTGEYYIGYQSTRGDYGTPPLFQASGVSGTFIMVSLLGSGSDLVFDNFVVDCASLGTCTGINTNGSGQGLVQNVTVRNSTAYGIFNQEGLGVVVRNAYITGCSGTAGMGLGAYNFNYNIEVAGCSVTGFVTVNHYSGCVGCISRSNSGATSYGFSDVATGGSFTCMNCVAYANGGDGFHLGANAFNNPTLINCIAESNGGLGVSTTQLVQAGLLLNYISYNNTGVAYTVANWPTWYVRGAIAATGEIFVNPGSGNMALNNSPTGGALVQGKGFPGTFQSGLTVGYQDIGAAQHKQPTNTYSISQ